MNNLRKLQKISGAGNLPDYFDLRNVIEMFLNGDLNEEEIGYIRHINMRASTYSHRNRNKIDGRFCNYHE